MPAMQSLRPRLVAAIVVSTILLLLAPFFGEVRRILRASFPTHFVLILGAAVAAMVVAALGVALVRVRDRRVLRYGAIAASVDYEASVAFARTYEVAALPDEAELVADLRTMIGLYRLLTLRGGLR